MVVRGEADRGLAEGAALETCDSLGALQGCAGVIVRTRGRVGSFDW